MLCIVAAIQDHPRLRGEHLVPIGRALSCPGSSPLARGARREAKHKARCIGIIPACAGSTGSPPPSDRSWGDHPRLRGEHVMYHDCNVALPGSSPLARGAQFRRARKRCDAGIIPACAGSTPGQTFAQTRRRDHPRLRGEHETFEREQTAVKGSSPLARGAQVWIVLFVLEDGIIPACAGSTRHGRGRARCLGDHPRLRGEHTSIPVILIQQGRWLIRFLIEINGSLPRTYGPSDALRHYSNPMAVSPSTSRHRSPPTV